MKRLLASGQPDRSYGRDGYAVLPKGKEAIPLGMIVQRDGGVIVAFQEATASPPGKHGVSSPHATSAREHRAHAQVNHAHPTIDAP